jgi:hypothetical protein
LSLDNVIGYTDHSAGMGHYDIASIKAIVNAELMDTNNKLPVVLTEKKSCHNLVLLLVGGVLPLFDNTIIPQGYMVVNRFMKKSYMNIYAVYAYKYSIHGSGRITL